MVPSQAESGEFPNGRAGLPRGWRWAVALGGVLVAAILGVIAWTLYDGRQAVRREAEQATRNIALTLEGNIARTVSLLDWSLRDAVYGMQLPGLAGLDPAVRQAVLFNRAVESRDFGGLWVIDAAGQVLYSSSSQRAWPGIAEQRFFRELAALRAPGLAMGGTLVDGADGGRGLVFARRIDAADGSFAGAAVALLRTGYFDALFGSLELGRDGVVSLYTGDGDMVARLPAGPADAVPSDRMLAALKRMGQGTIEVASFVDGVPRVFSYRQVGDLKLALLVGFATADIYAGWNEKAAILVAVLLVLVALSAVLAWSLRHHLRRRARAEAAAIAAMQEHAQALARLDTIFANSADSMLMVRVHPNGRLAYEAVNPVWQKLTGVAASAAVGRSPEECLPPQLAADTLVDWRECLRLRRIHRVTFRSEPPGIERDWEAAIAPVFDAAGEIQRLVSIGRDITQRNAMEANLREAHRAEAVGQLTAGIAHDFNNLLQAIGAGLDLLDEQAGLDEGGRASAATAADAAKRAATLVHRLLAFSRKQALRPVLLDPAQLLARMAPVLRRVLGEQIRVEVTIEGGVWQVHCDADQLENCLLNLALNARDAMPDGGVLRFRAANANAADAGRASLPAGEYTLFEVADTGMGMAPEVAARALEPFFTTRAIGQGAGLGLSMVQGFARQSGGDMRIDSAPGHGTTVQVFLPRSTAAPAAAPAEPRQDAETGPRGGHVLVVDDEAIIRQTLVAVLSRAGYRPFAVAGGQEALERLRAGHACDLLITDQSMPGMTGMQLVQLVAAFDPRLPTMLMTGFDKVSGLDEQAGDMVVLYKPFDRAALLRHVRALAGAPPDKDPDGIARLTGTSVS